MKSEMQKNILVHCCVWHLQTTRSKVYSDGTMAGLALHSHDSARDGHVKLLPRHPVLPTAMPVALV
jgi:hypothetical protein